MLVERGSEERGQFFFGKDVMEDRRRHSAGRNANTQK
jgi:hypothetical protein